MAVDDVNWMPSWMSSCTIRKRQLPQRGRSRADGIRSGGYASPTTG